MRVPVCSSGARTFDQALAYADNTKEAWEIMYVHTPPHTHSLPSSLLIATGILSRCTEPPRLV
jgi:hypothetical protein